MSLSSIGGLSGIVQRDGGGSIGVTSGVTGRALRGSGPTRSLILPCCHDAIIRLRFAVMAGIVALQGGGPFVANDEVDRRLLDGIDRIVVLPTADAYEQPQLLVDAALAWGTRIGVVVEPLMVLTRDQADAAAAAVVAAAPAVFLAGDSASHLRSVLKDTPLFEAIVGVVARGGTLIASGASAAALCDPMSDQRGGGFALGLGLVSGMAVIPASESWPHEQLERAHGLATTPLADLPTGSALIRRDQTWELVGNVTLQGDLPG
jgi:cyanophycinase